MRAAGFEIVEKRKCIPLMTRRDFLRISALLGAGFLLKGGGGRAAQAGEKTVVSLVRSDDRSAAVSKAIDLLGINPVRGKEVVIKPNFNSAHPFPGSTHNDTLRALIEKLNDMGAGSFKVADRSGMGNTRVVMQRKGIFDMAKEMGFEPIVLDELPKDEWKHFEMKGTHWKRGLFFPKLFLEAESIVQTCCLKTHRFGGHFTLSLKNSVGMVAKFSPIDNYNFMNELHSSPHMRLMIAEINLLYKPDLIVLDGMKAFVSGGPETGKLAYPGVMIAGTDRVAVDAVGVAVLRMFGTTPEVSAGEVFEQEQIRRAVELGLGVDSPEKIEIVVPDEESAEFARRLTRFLKASVKTAVEPADKLPVRWGELKDG